MQSLVPGYWGAHACTRSRQVRVRLPSHILGSYSQFANSNMGCVQVILVYFIAGCSPISCPMMSNSKCTPSNRYTVSKLAADSQRTEAKKQSRLTQVGLNGITPSSIFKICKSHSTSSGGIIATQPCTRLGFVHRHRFVRNQSTIQLINLTILY